MGKIIQANCECGFKSKELLAGRGFYTFTLTAPALCTNCYTFTTRNYFRKYNYCSKCSNRVIFYNNKTLWKDKNPSQDELDTIFWWNIDRSKGEAFVLPNTFFLCPKCRKYKMQFCSCGFYD